jgi:arylsulfatase A-like enzyme
MDTHPPFHHIRSYDSSLHEAPNSWTSVTDIDLWDVSFHDGIPEKKRDDIQNYRDLYATSIEYSDRIVSEFIQDVMAATNHDTTTIVTADHGENLGYDYEDHIMGHTSSLTESLLHVPFEIVNPPTGYDPTVSEYFSQLDLGALICGFADGNTPDVFRESPIAERITTSEVPDSASDPEFWERTLRCIYNDETKTVWDSEGQTVTYRLDSETPCWQERETESDERPEYDETYFEVDIQTAHDSLARDELALDQIDESTKKDLERLGYM